MTQIRRFAVAHGQPRENAQDLRVALNAERRIGEAERLCVETCLRCAPHVQVVREQRVLERRRNVDARVFQKRHQIVGERARECILEVEQPRAARPLALREPDEVRRMVVAQHPSPGLAGETREDIGPKAREVVVRILRNRPAMHGRPVPLGQQIHFDGEHAGILLRHAVNAAVGKRNGARNRQCAHRDERVDTRAPQLGLRRAGDHLAAEHAVAEVFEHEKAAVEIRRVDLRRAEPRRAQRRCDGHERAHVLGELGDAAVGLPIVDRRPVRLARLIHEDRSAEFPSALWGGVRGVGKPDRRSLGVPPSRPPPQGGRRRNARRTEASIGPRRRVPLKMKRARRVPRRMGVEEVRHRAEPGEPRRPGPMTFETHRALVRRRTLRKMDVETVRRAKARRPLRPFDQRRPRRQVIVEAEFEKLVLVPDAIEVEMHELEARRRIGLHERKGRARDFGGCVRQHRADERARERRLARAEVAVKRDHVAGRQLERHALRQPVNGGLRGVSLQPRVMNRGLRANHPAPARDRVPGSVPSPLCLFQARCRAPYRRRAGRPGS